MTSTSNSLFPLYQEKKNETSYLTSEPIVFLNVRDTRHENEKEKKKNGQMCHHCSYSAKVGEKTKMLRSYFCEVQK